MVSAQKALALLLAVACSALATAMHSQPVLLLSANFEGPGFMPGATMNQAGWATVNTTPGMPPGLEPLWYHQAHSAANPGGVLNPSPKTHMISRLGNTNLGGANFFGANLHWRGLTTAPNNSHNVPYSIDLTSPPFAAALIPPDHVITIEFDLAVDLLRESTLTPGGLLSTHFLDVNLLDNTTGIMTPVMPGSWIATTIREDMCRYVYEVGPLPTIPATGLASGWNLVLTARSNAAMSTELYDFWIDNVIVRMDYHVDFTPPPAPDGLETASDPMFHPVPPLGPITNNNTMTHPALLPFPAPGTAVTFGGLNVSGLDEDYYSLPVVDPATGMGAPFNVNVVAPGGGPLEVELYRVVAVAVDPTIPTKFVRAQSVSYTNDITVLPGTTTFDVNGQYFARTRWIIRVTSLAAIGVVIPYTLTITEVSGAGIDWYLADGEGGLGAANDDSYATAVPPPAPGIARFLHEGDVDYHLVFVPTGSQIMPNLTDVTAAIFGTAPSDGLQMSLIRAETGAVVAGPKVFADIDETGVGAWVGNQAETAHIAVGTPPFAGSFYFIRVWRSWQTTTAAGFGTTLAYTLSAVPTAAAAPRTIHAPGAPGVTSAPVFGAVGAITTFAITTTLGHPDHNFTTITLGPVPIPPTVGPSGTIATTTTAWPSGALQLNSFVWDATGATSPGFHSVTIIVFEHLYDRTMSPDDIPVTLVVLAF